MNDSLMSVEVDGDYVDLPTPKIDGYSVATNEITRSSRNMLGTLYKYRVAVKTTITVAWVGISPESKNELLSLTGDNSFRLKYYDTVTGEYKAGKFYRGNDLAIRPYPPRMNGEFPHYDVSFSMVEF